MSKATSAASAATDEPRRTHRSLAWRLGLLLGVTVVAVLLLAGVIVNRVVSTSFETVLTDQQQQRLDDAAVTLADRLARPAGPARAQAFVMRLANALDGEIRVIGTDGTTLAAFGRARDGDRTSYTAPIELDGRVVATLEADLPSRANDRGFLRLFNVTLLVAGLETPRGGRHVVERSGEPAGDPSARASGGDDRESTELAEAFNAMADRLERSEMLRRRAASDIAHDLATPATVLESQLQAMIDGVVPTDAAGLEAARSAAAALGGVVADIDDLASAEAAPLQARPAAIDVAEAVRDVVLGLDGLARERSSTIDIRVAPGTVAWADPGHFARALRNVVANGLAHGPPGGSVEVAAAPAGRVVHLTVSDQGPGIPAGDVEHVFERFYRADASRATDPVTGRPGGLGLGLTIARELLAANGGRIAVERTGPEGTTFAIEVPAATRV